MPILTLGRLLCLWWGIRHGLSWLIDLFDFTLGCLSAFSTIVGGPKSQVVSKELHDQSAISVGLLRQRIKLSNCIVKGLLGKVAGSVRRIQDLVVEDGEVQSEAEADWMSRCELTLSNVGCGLLQELVSFTQCV